MQQFTLYFMRHGQTTRNNHLLGRTNVPLSVDGWQQMSDSLATTVQFDQIITSPLIRCHDFACDYAKLLNKPLHIDPNLQELDFGAWDGQSSRRHFAFVHW